LSSGGGLSSGRSGKSHAEGGAVEGDGVTGVQVHSDLEGLVHRGVGPVDDNNRPEGDIKSLREGNTALVNHFLGGDDNRGSSVLNAVSRASVNQGISIVPVGAEGSRVGERGETSGDVSADVHAGQVS